MMLSNYRRWLIAVVVLALLPHGGVAQEQGRPPLPDYLEVSIKSAIESGKKFLLRTQKPTGSWAEGEGNKFGYAALPALTLLELGVSPKENSIQAAAYLIRAHLDPKRPGFKELTNVYEVSLALLFLDRLGDKKDKEHIETLAARLIASQTPTGGWGYTAQLLNAADNAKILKLVRELEPMPLQHLLAGRVPGMDNHFVKRDPVGTSELNPPRTAKVPKELVLLPCFTQFGTYPVVEPDPKKVPPGAHFLSTTDNSTTQFALLALWAARRHKIPVTRTGSMAFMRFHVNQGPDGGWGYGFGKGGSGNTDTMMAPGLLGLAIGHGIVREMGLQDDPPVDEDPRIINAFKALANHVGTPKDTIKDLDYPNLYFLWGLERVCMLYNVHMVGDKDWYRWGAEALVANQDQVEGSWFKANNYPGASPTIDTCFALMFLKRANLAQDLSAYLTFSPKKLNDGVVKLLPPPAPKVETKPEPPKVVEQKPEPKVEPKVEEKKPVQVAEAKPPDRTPTTAPPTPPQAAPAPEPPAPAGAPVWIWIVIGLGGLLIVGGLLVFFLMKGGSQEEDEEEEEEERPRKKPGKKSRR